MAQVIEAYIYGINSPGGQTEIASAAGQLNLFAIGSGVHFYPTTEVRGVAEVQCNSVIEVLPTGLNQISTKYFTDKTLATILTEANDVPA
jgi:hypothetical protein